MWRSVCKRCRNLDLWRCATNISTLLWLFFNSCSLILLFLLRCCGGCVTAFVANVSSLRLLQITGQWASLLKDEGELGLSVHVHLFKFPCTYAIHGVSRFASLNFLRFPSSPPMLLFTGRLFRVLDMDGDGIVSVQELKQSLAGLSTCVEQEGRGWWG